MPSLSKAGWVTIDSFFGMILFTMHSTNYKNWKDRLMIVMERDNCSMVMFEETGEHQFPLYRTNKLTPINDLYHEFLRETKREVFDLLEMFYTII